MTCPAGVGESKPAPVEAGVGGRQHWQDMIRAIEAMPRRPAIEWDDIAQAFPSRVAGRRFGRVALKFR